MSGRHCELSRSTGCKAFLKDVSSNGTLLNGKRIAKNVEVGVARGVVWTVITHIMHNGVGSRWS